MWNFLQTNPNHIYKKFIRFKFKSHPIHFTLHHIAPRFKLPVRPPKMFSLRLKLNFILPHFRCEYKSYSESPQKFKECSQLQGEFKQFRNFSPHSWVETISFKITEGRKVSWKFILFCSFLLFWWKYAIFCNFPVTTFQ